MHRVFYFSGYRLTVFHWDKNQCIDRFAFDPSDEGLEKFTTYLRATDKTPVRLLVDLIEEDFSRLSIPHVGNRDRNTIVKRMIDRQYRRSRDFFHYQVIGREPSGRRDDILLYSVLTNPSILDPWLDIMQQAQIPLNGIWSLPVITPKLYPYLKTDAENVLLVSQQVPSNLRQTFLHKGRLESSRSAVVNLEDASIGQYIFTEVEQTIHYLSNHRNIGFDDKIEVHILCREKDIDDIRRHCEDTVLRQFICHPVHPFSEQLDCADKTSDYCSGLYACLCLRHEKLPGHYGNSTLFNHYYRHLASLSLKVASILLLVGSVITAFGYFSGARNLSHESRLLNEQTSALNHRYQDTFANIEPRLSSARMMESSVLLHDHIKQYAQVSPQQFLSQISMLLSQAKPGQVQINRVSWQRTRSDEFSDTRKSPATTPDDVASSQPYHHSATIGGQVLLDNQSLRQAFDITRSITEQLGNDDRIFNIRLVRTPVDVNPDARIENELQSQTTYQAQGDDRSRFEIQLIMKADES